MDAAVIGLSGIGCFCNRYLNFVVRVLCGVCCYTGFRCVCGVDRVRGRYAIIREGEEGSDDGAEDLGYSDDEMTVDSVSLEGSNGLEWEK